MNGKYANRDCREGTPDWDVIGNSLSHTTQISLSGERIVQLFKGLSLEGASQLTKTGTVKQNNPFRCTKNYQGPWAGVTLGCYCSATHQECDNLCRVRSFLAADWLECMPLPCQTCVPINPSCSLCDWLLSPKPFSPALYVM